MFLSLPVLERLEVLRQLKACLDGSRSNQLPSLDDLAASFLEQRQQGTQPSPSEERIRVLEAPEAEAPPPSRLRVSPTRRLRLSVPTSCLC
jgi:hypothetical protein